MCRNGVEEFFTYPRRMKRPIRPDLAHWHRIHYFNEAADVVGMRMGGKHNINLGDALLVQVGQCHAVVIPAVNEGRYGGVSFLFTGDAEWPAEEAILATIRDKLPSTILKVGHHASHTSSSSDFLAAVRSEIAVYSAGSDNTYGHPHPATITNLQAVGATIYGTDVNGTVFVTTDGIDSQVIPSRDPQGQPGGPTATLDTSLGYDPNGPDRDYGAFETHAEAQAFFIAAGGPARDPHRLDGDNDGIACESLP
jgi:competence protein ComEC